MEENLPGRISAHKIFRASISMGRGQLDEVRFQVEVWQRVWFGAQFALFVHLEQISNGQWLELRLVRFVPNLLLVMNNQLLLLVSLLK